MDNLPSKSLSKSILIAIPLFCLVLAILDTSDQLSYLFVLEFLDNIAGTPDITFLPSQQPEIGQNYQKYQYFSYHGINLMQSGPNTPHVPLVRKKPIDQWAAKYSIIRGVSPRWIVPVVVNRTDSLILVSNISNELNMGVGIKSGLHNLNDQQVALPKQLMDKLSKKVGDKLSIKLSIKDIFNGRRLIEKYKSSMSHDENSLIVQQELNIQLLSKYIYNFTQEQGKTYNITITEQQITELVKYIYNLEYQLDYTIKYEYQNSGLYSNALSDVVLMEFAGFARLLTQFYSQSILKSKQFEKTIFDQIDKIDLSLSQKMAIKTYFRIAKNSNQYQSELTQSVKTGLEDNPLMMIASYNHRQLVYHPQKMQQAKMYSALENSPGDFLVAAVYPLYQQLDGIRYFFKSVIQIFIFVCGVIFFYTMRLILKQIYEQKEIEVGIWRTLGAGGVKEKDKKQSDEQVSFRSSQLKSKLSLSEKISYGYRMLVKVGFLYYWLFSCLISVALYQISKWILYNIVAAIFKSQAPPPQYLWSPIILFLVMFGFTMTLIILHIRQIYVNPLVSTIKPVKRTFDVVKVRVIKIATFGITLEVLIIGIMLVYYGVVSYYWIPLSILQNNGDLQTLLFNSIFIFMILGSIMVLVVVQSRMECGVLNLLFYLNKHLSTMKLIMLKSIKAKQYKNLKVSLIISLIFAFLLFFTAGINIELKIVQSFTERQVGADLMISNFQKSLDRSKIEQYLNTVKGAKYMWFSKNLEGNDIKIAFQSITKKGLVTSRFQTISANYLDIAYYQYYYPERYFQPGIKQLQTLPNGVANGFTTLYKYGEHYNNISVGHFNPDDTLLEYDPHHINVPGSSQVKQYKVPRIPEKEQVINLVVANVVRKKLGANAGDYLKLSVNNTITGQNYNFRCRVMHSFKVTPSVDIYSNYAFMSESQGKYLYDAIGYNGSQIGYYKVLITGAPSLQEIANKVTSISPDHTQAVLFSQVRLTFSLIQSYLNGFVLFITLILSVLAIMFLGVYTYGKCKEEAEVFKMLRAIGLSVFDIRLMIYLEILVRMVISIINGILLGLLFSLGLAGQVEEVLMLKAPLPDLGIVFVIAILLLAIFSATVIRSTEYLTKRTVLQTSKL